MVEILFDPLVFFIVGTCIAVLTLIANSLKPSTSKLPLGPRPIPIIGNLLDLDERPHNSLANLSKTYGPIMRLKLGSTTNIIISSPKLAKEVLQKNDQIFCNRVVPDITTGYNHHKFSVVWLDVSPQWKNLRKICTVQMFSKLNATQALRQKKVQQLMDYIQEKCKSGPQVVDIGQATLTTSFNLLSSAIFSTDMAHYDSNIAQEFKGHILSIIELVGRVNVSDIFPALRLLDLQGIRRQGEKEVVKIFEIIDNIINERSKLRTSMPMASANNDVLDAFLNFTNDDDHEFSYNDIKHLLLDLFIAGSEATSTSVEWAMAELLRSPIKLAKARNELQQVLGKDKAQFQESDISSLPYLEAIIKETLRMHPPTPLLVPHKAEIDVEIDGYTLPKDAKVLVNAWAIARDPSIWENPNSFEPERFFKLGIDVKGQDFELIPFGSGRRICPGMHFAQRTMHLMLASLLHSFDWMLPDGLKPEDMDMSDKFGMTLQKAKPLLAIPIIKTV